jgi:hypothetical protein
LDSIFCTPERAGKARDQFQGQTALSLLANPRKKGYAEKA